MIYYKLKENDPNKSLIIYNYALDCYQVGNNEKAL